MKTMIKLFYLMIGVTMFPVNAQTLLDKSMSVSINDSCIFLEIKYSNVSDRILYIDPVGLPIVVSDESGKELDYLGVAIKRTPLTKSDYVLLKPTEKYERKVNISKLYSFQSKRSYTIGIPGGYYDPFEKVNFEAPFVKMEFKTK